MIEFLKSLFMFLWYDDEDDLDLDWVPTSQEEAEIQQEMNHDWVQRQTEKGGTV